MTPQLISIYALVAMFVVATLWPINMGVLAFVGAFLVGTLLAGRNPAKSSSTPILPKAVSFLTLVGITWLFALTNNGTIDWLVRLSVRAVKGRLRRHPVDHVPNFRAPHPPVGAVSPGAVAIIAPIALGFAFRYQISPLLMGLMVVHSVAGRRLLPNLDLRRHHQRRRPRGPLAALRRRPSRRASSSTPRSHCCSSWSLAAASCCRQVQAGNRGCQRAAHRDRRRRPPARRFSVTARPRR